MKTVFQVLVLVLLTTIAGTLLYSVREHRREQQAATAESKAAKEALKSAAELELAFQRLKGEVRSLAEIRAAKLRQQTYAELLKKCREDNAIYAGPDNCEAEVAESMQNWH